MTTSSPRTILVGVDGSPEARWAIKWAATRAAATVSVILAVHVLTYSDEFNPHAGPAAMTTWRRELARNLHGPWTEPVRDAGVSLRTSLVEADSPAQGLLDAVAGSCADLVVLGTRGQGRLAERIVGGTAYKVTHRVRVPVVIVPLRTD